ncbi:putative ACN9 family domain-containing protein [Emericellopsis atlantica]|uniref:Succinate dehydrogenase assembly factor 3 n=1 Tax=Emericellopsis atlantica TaxID=2614577 RepID=A0A9P7ZL02_9HYPO|nr:putative ACN9 family domain-containing protein [Emericellopsis atlantica]KAG9253520.1 putative ACN9 family domain-containing protein [Emericellopsis atlantica]
MRSSIARQAAATAASGFKPSPMALLPPIPLYRRLFRAHRKHLPREMRVLGDEYIKAEFRAHRKVDNPAHLIGFLTEWQLYAQKVEGDAWKGEKIEDGKLQKLSDEQVHQLYELMQAIQKRGSDDDGSSS